MKAIILAAGLASRLRPLTEILPKCLLELHGRTVMDYQIDVLRAAGIDDVLVITGHMGERIQEAMGDRVRYTSYADYASTNNLYTLHACAEHLDDSCIILFSDVLLSASAMQSLAESSEDFSLLVDTSRVLAGTMRIVRDDRGITDLGGHIPTEVGIGNFVGIAKFSKRGALLLRQELSRMVEEGGHEQDYYVQALPRLAAAGEVIEPMEIQSPWCEIDDADDYAAAKEENFYVMAETQTSTEING